MTGIPEEKLVSDALAARLDGDAEEVREERGDWADWMLDAGKDPAKQNPLSFQTAVNYIQRLDKVHRHILDYLDPDSRAMITDEQADEYLHLLARDEIVTDTGEAYTSSSKRKLTNALSKYFEWRYHEKEMAYQWKSRIAFSANNHTSAAKFTYDELGRLLNAAKTHGSLPSYYEASDDERDRINGLIAQRLSKPKDSVTRKDWIRADQSKKTWALIAVSYDAGLTPIEIAEAKLHWFDSQRNVFRIPSEKACKQREKEEVALSDESAEALSEWIQERRHLEKYDGTNNLWLNREGNAYQSGSLCSLLRTLCDEAGISTSNREIRWYSLRHTLGRNMTSEGELSEANDQLRHQSLETTQGTYNDSPLEKLHQTINATHEKAQKAADDPTYNPYDEEKPRQSNTGDTADTVGESDEVVTSVGGGRVHVDGVIRDTTAARVDITRQILPDSND